MHKSLFSTAVLMTLLSIGTDLHARTCSRHSPAHTVALLELYTSEGCDSCPPADRFISGLRASGLGPEQVVPLALHVDYWDYIGWKDVFASRTFTERQRWLAATVGSRTLYTPEMFVAGRELRNWRNSTATAVRAINQRPAQADIAIGLGSVASGSLAVEVSVKVAQSASLFVALYQSGLATEVKAGENRGVTLKHDYVVRDWIGPVALDASRAAGAVSLPRPLRLPADAAVRNLGVAVFIQRPDGEVLQALSQQLCN